MSIYFDEQESLYNRYGNDDLGMLKVIANRYLGANPKIPFTYRLFNRSGILQTAAGLYDLNMHDKLPEAVVGQFVYAYALVWSESERNLDLTLSCLGPIRFYFNQSLCYRSNVIDEIKPDAKVKLNVDFNKGWNRLFIQARKTTAGFGCLFGADEAKVRILNVLSPFRERQGQSGWIYSEPTWQDYSEVSSGLDPLALQAESGLQWLPKHAWDQAERELTAFERLFGTRPGQHAYAWSQLNIAATKGVNLKLKLKGRTKGPFKLWIENELIVAQETSGGFECELHYPNGSYNVAVQGACVEAGWGFQLELIPVNSGEACLTQPKRVHGYNEPWFYLGPFDTSVELTPKDIYAFNRIYSSDTVSGDHRSGRYWQLDAPSAWLRPYYENAMLSNKWTTGGATNYARWDYPLGVTMYGLLQTGRILERQDIVDYAVGHIQTCTAMDDYALWDREAYGFPAINQQLVMMTMLDNCGSFGSAMLEAYQDCRDEGFLKIAKRIADFMTRQLERKPNGAFYRTCIGDYSENTLWADDLYMSTPFMRRYARITGDTSFLEEAVKQFKLFKDYLFISEQQIMSHVFDFKYGVRTGIPWGRGNGWTIFSLSEVLEELPIDHPERPFLIQFFNQLCEGYLALQGEHGLWHQVLTHPDAYEEASCTAMFIYAYARGVRYNWLDTPDKYRQAAYKGWSGLTQCAIDIHGNVHGVCSGSRYSFTADYYKEDLLTVTNDNHGIGIMLLAAVEVIKLKNAQKTE